MDLKALLLTQGVIVATCLCTLVGAAQSVPEPSASSPSPSSSSLPSSCSRSYLTTLWASAFAFVSLMADAWPAAKAVALVFGDASSVHRWLNFLIFAPFGPWLGIFLCDSRTPSMIYIVPFLG
ncbi:unnamed protein product [Sphagnum tenellum]